MYLPTPGKRWAIAVLSATIASSALAHGAHVHGIATLDVMVENRQVTLHLASPLANLTGFEYTPATETDRDKVRAMAARLRDSITSFVPAAAAGCTLTSVTLHADNIPAALLGQAGATGRRGDHTRQHGKSHMHAHADLDASFVFDCTSMPQLQYMDMPLFTTFPGIERLDVQIVTPTRQSAATLQATSPRLQLD